MSLVLGLFLATAGILHILKDESSGLFTQLLTLGGGISMFCVGLKMMGVV